MCPRRNSGRRLLNPNVQVADIPYPDYDRAASVRGGRDTPINAGCEYALVPPPHGHGSEALSEPRALASGSESPGHSNFPNNEKDRKLASELQAYDDKAIARAVMSGALIEVISDEKEIP